MGLTPCKLQMISQFTDYTYNGILHTFHLRNTSLMKQSLPMLPVGSKHVGRVCNFLSSVSPHQSFEKAD